MAEHARVGAIDDVIRVIDEFVVVGTIGDHKTVRELADSGLAGGGLGLLFLDHAKEAYVPDLQRILAGG